MEITEAFQQQESSANAVTSATAAATAAVVAAATCLNKTPVHRSGSNEPKRSPNCNGHASSGLQVYRDGEISFIPLQERGIIIHGTVMNINFERYNYENYETLNQQRLSLEQTPNLVRTYQETPLKPKTSPEPAQN